jgi:hypothetical protein
MNVRKPAVALDALMSVAETLERLALRGFWVDPQHGAAHARIDSLARRLGHPFDEVAKQLARDSQRYGAAIRQQAGAAFYWFAVELRRVLDACMRAPPDALLRDVLRLRIDGAHPTIQAGAELPFFTGIVMDNGVPISVSFGDAHLPPAAAAGSPVTTRSGTKRAAPPRDTSAWPRVDSPSFVRSRERFKVLVGFAPAQQSGVAGGPVILQAPAGAKHVDVTVLLSADTRLTDVNGWSRTMTVDLDDVLSASVEFELVAGEPERADLPHLTMLDVRYLCAGVVCGMASKPLVILHANVAAPENLRDDENVASTAIVLRSDAAPPDLTIEIMKADRTAPQGQFTCHCHTPHTLQTPLGPFPMDLGQDASTFSTALADELDLFAESPLLETTLEGIGKLIAQRLPPDVNEALREVAAITAPEPPAVMLVSAEPCVPWELAWIEPPLDAQRPPFLAAQVALGRWLRDGKTAAGRDPSGNQRPSPHPNETISVHTVAAMTAWYKSATGLMRLRKAEAEARAIAERYEGVELRATGQSLRSLLSGEALERGAERVGPATAMHFSGHGDFDPSKPDAAALYLEDGSPVRSTNFRAARFAAGREPLLFLNACMLGVGDELLGDMAGFPGNSLRGGFAGVIGALWRIEDAAAQDFALEFWRRALPPPPDRGEPIGLILRDLRAKYRTNGATAPPATYLAYTYYGHPRLRLQRVAKQPEST